MSQRMSLTSRVRRFLGLCPHWWGEWQVIRSESADPVQFMADDKIELGVKRECQLCGHTQQHYWGHAA